MGRASDRLGCKACRAGVDAYPGSAYAEKARQVLPKIEARLKADTGAGEKTP